MTARERAENIVYDIGGVTRMCPSIWEPHVALVEKHLLASEREGYRKGVEAAAIVLGDWEQGTLEMVNSGDATMDEVYLELRKLKKIERSIRALLSKEEG